jgi:hypothetical protein
MKTLFASVAAFFAGLALPLLLLRVLWGYDLVRVFLTSNGLRDSLYYHQRPYILSMLNNLLDYFVFAGVPLALLFLWSATRRTRSSAEELDTAANSPEPGLHDAADAVPKSSFAPGRLMRGAPVLFALLLVLVALEISGRVRGEAARMWMFLMPPLAVIAAPLARDLWKENRAVLGWALALQTAQILVFQYFVRVWGY